MKITVTNNLPKSVEIGGRTLAPGDNHVLTDEVERWSRLGLLKQFVQGTISIDCRCDDAVPEAVQDAPQEPPTATTAAPVVTTAAVSGRMALVAGAAAGLVGELAHRLVGLL